MIGEHSEINPKGIEEKIVKYLAEGQLKISFAGSSNETREIDSEPISGHLYIYNLSGVGDSKRQIKVWVPEETSDPQKMDIIVATPQGDIEITGENKNLMYTEITRQVSAE